jgi:hypothetical protein
VALAGAGGGGGAEGTIFSGMTREATTVLRTSRPLWASARTTVVIRLGDGSGDAPRSPKATSVMAPSIKQMRISLFGRPRNLDFSLYRFCRPVGTAGRQSSEKSPRRSDADAAQ